jgi:hypothetical protein
MECFEDLLQAIAEGLGGQIEQVHEHGEGSHFALLITAAPAIELLQETCKQEQSSWN